MKSFIEVNKDSHFPIQNLPYGSFIRKDGSHKKAHIGVAIGEYILDITELEREGAFKDIKFKNESVFASGKLNDFMSEGYEVWKSVRECIQKILNENETWLKDNESLINKVLLLQKEAEMQLPVRIYNYTDFYSSKDHAMNAGTIFRGKDQALLSNWTSLPVAYHGRANTVVLSGVDIHRPKGQILKENTDRPVLSESEKMDFELELGFLMGTGNKLGEAISIDDAKQKVFGAVLVNDWSARDIQQWENKPLGPFLSKNFATSISPWVVTMEALDSFKVKGPDRDHEILEYLQENPLSSFDIKMEVSLKTCNMENPQTIVKTNYKYMYWSIFQQIAHHTISGCNLETGDLLASGTISGPEQEMRGCMLEITWGGKEPIKLTKKESRTWLMDGDEIAITGWCENENYKIGFGNLVSRLLPSK